MVRLMIWVLTPLCPAGWAALRHIPSLKEGPSLVWMIGLLLLLPKAMSFAGDSPRTVDLGEMSVNGEIRRPSIQWIDSQKPVKDLLPEIVKIEFERFEAALLAPAQLQSLEGAPKTTAENSHAGKVKSSLSKVKSNSGKPAPNVNKTNQRSELPGENHE